MSTSSGDDVGAPSASPEVASPLGSDSNVAFANIIDMMPPQMRDAIQESGTNPQILSMVAAFSASMYAGPLPPPDQLKAYEDILPGSANRIIKMAENQAEHRQEIEKVAVKGGNSRSWWGLWLGFSIAVIALAASVVLVLTGHSPAGITIAGIDIVGLAAVFVYGKSDQRKERVQKELQTRQPG